VTNDVVGDSLALGEDAPRRVGSFEILEEIGRGGMGIVYRARDTRLEREVALKRPKCEALARADFRRRFMNEARTASQIMHPHITTVFEVFEDGGVPWLVMELIDGASLRSMIGKNDPLSCEEVLKHAEGLADGLRVAHLCAVLHLDINPNNILVGKDGRARLTDFGLARAWIDPSADRSTSQLSTNSGSSSSGVAGTRGYMSPEQALGKPIDPRSDIFSLGAVFYEMCTGRPAFFNPETGEWLDALLHREPQPISRVNHDVPIEFEEIVKKSLVKRAFQRYQSADEMLLDLRAVRRKLESSSGYTVPRFYEVPRRRARWIAAGVVAVGVVAAGFIVKGLMSFADRAPMLKSNHRRLTTDAGCEGRPAVSPDGTMIAYASDSAGNPDIWVIRTDGGEPLQLTHDAAADTDPAWYPDGGEIFFVSDRDGNPAIWRIPTLGGSPVKLLPDAEDPAISPDGTRIAFSRAGQDGLTRIGVAPLDDPSSVQILTGDGDGFWWHTSPAWSPDGLTVVYADFENLWRVPARGGPAIQLTTSDAVDRNPVWSPDGRFLFFSSTRDSAPALWCLRISDGSLHRLTAGTGNETEPSLSRDGRRMAYSTSDTNSDIVVIDRMTGLRTYISGATDEIDPVVAPDGTSLVFVSDRRGKYDLWMQPLRESRPDGPPRRLTDHRGSAAVPEFSRDGRWIAYHRVVDGQRDIWIVPVTGGVPRQFTEHPGTDVNPSFSPDGSMIAFVSDREGARRLWVAPVADGRRVGEPRKITAGPDGYWHPAWSPDGTRIACIVEDGYDSEVLVVWVDSEAPPAHMTSGAGAGHLRWSAAGDELLVSGLWGSDQSSLRAVSLRDRSTRRFDPAADFGSNHESGPGRFGLDAAERFLAYEVYERSGDLWLAETDLGRPRLFPWR